MYYFPADTIKKEVRRISRQQVPVIPVDDPQPVGRRSPSPAKNLATNIIHIHRLVRPYTLGQLKELLSHTGTIVDDGFWIDKIKSHCLVGVSPLSGFLFLSIYGGKLYSWGCSEALSGLT